MINYEFYDATIHSSTRFIQVHIMPSTSLISLTRHFFPKILFMLDLIRYGFILFIYLFTVFIYFIYGIYLFIYIYLFLAHFAQEMDKYWWKLVPILKRDQSASNMQWTRLPNSAPFTNCSDPFINFFSILFATSKFLRWFDAKSSFQHWFFQRFFDAE